FEEILEAMDGLPVTIRLLDPPLHEFLPDLTSLSVAVARAEERGDVKESDLRLLAAVERLHESNPMLGLRGVRLGLAIPGLFGLQVRAIAQAAAARKAAGGDPRAEIMIPLVGAVQELELIKDEAEQVIAAVAAESGSELEFQIGTMIELPRAAMTADQIAEAAEFFSFGTNDLTQTTWGFSRDDVEGAPGEGRVRGLAVRVHRPRRRRCARAARGREGPGYPPGHQARRVRRARRRPRVGALLRRGRAGLRVLLALPGAGGAT
ncbi:MAG: hypothetical protein MUD13_12005, partial [Candidatus Nanopelagicales bacterium]|nr:hypothetical protein [Candidatus Nanopelagicales bacterium]